MWHSAEKNRDAVSAKENLEKLRLDGRERTILKRMERRTHVANPDKRVDRLNRKDVFFVFCLSATTSLDLLGRCICQNLENMS